MTDSPKRTDLDQLVTIDGHAHVHRCVDAPAPAVDAETAELAGVPAVQSFAAEQPVRRLPEPSEVAAVLAFLAGPGSSAMTGAVVPSTDG